MSKKNVLMVLFAGFTSVANAADISLVSGLYKNESSKSEGKSTGSTSHFGLKGRFHDDLSENMAWYGIGGLSMTSYSAADGRKSPDNFVGIDIGGGIRHYFKAFAAGVVPFASGGARISNDKEVEYTSTGYIDTTTNGLRYEAAVGIRAGLDENFFAELELPLFDNALFGVRKKVTVVDAVGTTSASESKEETTYSELWVDSTASIVAARVALGYKF